MFKSLIDTFIIGALSSLVISAFYFLFKKPRKKLHLYIQNAILIVLTCFILIAFIASLTIIIEFPILIIPIIIVAFLGEFFILKKLFNNSEQLINNDFENKQSD